MSTAIFPTLAISIIRHRLILAVLAATLVLGIAPHARAQRSAIDFVQKVGETAIADLTDPKISDSERVTRMRKLLVNVFDVRAVSRFVLGPFARRTTDEEFETFKHLYKIYVAHSYAALFKKYKGEKILMQRAQPLGNDEINVIGVIRQVSGPDISMEMRVRMVKGAYRALDLKIEGVSMPLAHQKQFASVITQRGNKVSGLISALKATTDRFEAQTPSQ
jgi:phospholipid transport system substrate-binding protein